MYYIPLTENYMSFLADVIVLFSNDALDAVSDRPNGRTVPKGF